MADELLAEFSAAGSLLSALAERPGYSKASAAQRVRLEGLMRRKSLPSGDLGRLAVAIKGCGFEKADENILLDAVADLVGGDGLVVPKASRNATQDFSSLVHFLTDTVWATLRSGDSQACCRHLIKLGLRNPSEPTALTMAVTMLYASEGVQQTVEMASAMKLEFVRSVKGIFRAESRSASPPAVWIDRLPPSPCELKDKFPTLYDSAFSEEDPAPSAISEIELATLRRGSRMRQVRGQLAAVAAVAPPQPLALSLEPLAALLQLAMSSAQPRVERSLQLQFGGDHGLRPRFALGDAPRRARPFDRIFHLDRHALGDDAGRDDMQQLQPRRSEDFPPAVTDAQPRHSHDSPRPLPRLDGGNPPPCDDESQHLPVKQGVKRMSVDEATAEVLQALDAAKSAKGAKGAKVTQGAKAANVTQSAKAAKATQEATVAKGAKVAQGAKAAKAEAAVAKGAKVTQGAKSAAVAKTALGKKATKVTTDSPACPPLRKAPPIKIGSCTIYSDCTGRQWRAIEASNRRRDVKFAWKSGAETKASWERCLNWCRDNSKA